jgi:hypothetical protein
MNSFKYIVPTAILPADAKPTTKNKNAVKYILLDINIRT